MEGLALILVLTIISSPLYAVHIDSDEIMLNAKSRMLEYVSTLYNESDTFDSIALKNHSAFCPNHALCSGDDTTNSNTNDMATYYENVGDLFQLVNYTAESRALARQDISQLAFYVNLHRAVIGPSATLTGR